MRQHALVGKSMSIVIALALMIVSAPIVAAQTQDFEPDFYESALTGYEIEVSGPYYEITEAELQEYLTGEGEVIHIGSDSVTANLEISFFDDADTPLETIDIYLQSMENVADSLEVLDRGTIDDRLYAIALVEYEGIEILYFVLVEEDIQGNVDLLQSMLTTSASVEVDLEDAQAEVTIDGVPFMDGIDPAQVAEVALESGTLGEPDDATPAAGEETYTFTDSGVIVGIGEDFAFVGDPQNNQGVEAVQIEGPDTLSMIAIGETGAAPEVALESFAGGVISNYDDSDIVDEESDDESAWRLLQLHLNSGESTFMLVVVDTTTVPGFELLEAHEVPANSVAGSLAVIQEKVTINGEPVLHNFDIEMIGDLATTDDAGTPESTETPEATSEAGDSRTGDPRTDARLPEPDDEPVDDDPDQSGNTSETGGSLDPVEQPTQEPAADTDVPGTLTDTSWEGDVNGSLVEWDADLWFVDAEQEGDLVSDDEFQEDTIVLQQQTDVGTSLLFVSVYGDSDFGPRDYMDQWLSDEYLTTFTDSGAEAEVMDYRTVNGNVSVIFHVTAESGTEYIVVRQAVMLEDGSILLVTLDTPAEDMPGLYESAAEVTIDGESVMRVFSFEQIERSIGD